MIRASKTKPKTRPKKEPEAGYFQQTHRPLHCLVFLLPLLIVYEAGLALTRMGATAQPDLVAVDLLRKFLAIFGATGYHLPALAVVAILLSWQWASKEPWKVHWPTILGMTGESMILALGLQGLGRAVDAIHATQLAAGAVSHMWLSQLVLSVGAGIYEELVFRLILISLLSLVLVDLLRLPKEIALAGIIVLSSLAFAGMHYPPLGGDTFIAGQFAFRLLAGGFLASVFVLRGFAVAVGAHAFYDIMAFTIRVITST